ncbi:MAG TPA: 16S rRNA (uracil(1498)-N(3))-methyltransferase [Dehalococcoidia bacterium]|nr:16S rRNA (uracil(1498)-N(3))-methyltransferase [Dehalococcoidia bacterium]
MRRLYVEGPLAPGRVVILEGDAARRVTRVLRLRPGERLALFDGSGTEAVAELARVAPARVEAVVLSVQPGLPEPPVRITLCQSVVKGERFEWALEKGTEIGVARFVPLVARRNVVRPGEGAKLERWRRIVIEAAEQCGRSAVPEVTAPASLDDVLESLDGPAIVPYEGERETGIAAALRAMGRPRALTILIGPEGGFTPDEIERAMSRGARPVSLGPRILRSETAGIVAAALALAVLGGLEPPGAPQGS